MKEFVKLFVVLKLSTDRVLHVVELGNEHRLEITEFRKRLAIVPTLHFNLTIASNFI